MKMTDTERALFQVEHWNMHIPAPDDVVKTIKDALEMQPQKEVTEKICIRSEI